MQNIYPGTITIFRVISLLSIRDECENWLKLHTEQSILFIHRIYIVHSMVNLSDSRDLRCNIRLEIPNYNTIKYGENGINNTVRGSTSLKSFRQQIILWTGSCVIAVSV